MRRLLAEGGLLARLAWPILVTQLAYMAMAATDTIMAGRLDATALAAVGLANAAWVPVATFIGGTLHILLPLIAGHAAAGRTGAAGCDGIQAAWLGVLLGGVAALLLTGAGPSALAAAGVAPELVTATTSYLYALAPGMPFYGLWTAARFFCDGHSDTRPAMATAIVVAVLNAPLNLVFMHSEPFGLGLGVAGIGLASALSLAIGALLMAARAVSSRRYSAARLGEAPRLPQPAVLGSLLARGGPIGLMFLAEYLAMSAVAVMIGRLGAAALAAHQIALNVSMTVFMVPVSVAMALSIRVGAAASRGDDAAARAQTVAALLLGVGAAGGLALAGAVFSDQVAAAYTADRTVRDAAATLLDAAAFFQVAAALQAIVAGALRGRGDVRVPFAVTVAAYWLVGLPLGWVMSAGAGVAGWWMGITAAVIVAGLLMALRNTAGAVGAAAPARDGAAAPAEPPP